MLVTDAGKQTRTPELERNLIAVLLVYSTNLGLTRMAEACGVSYDILAWTAEWYVREETLRAANLAIIDSDQRLPRSTGPCATPSTQLVTCLIRTIGARSPASSTRANPCTRCAGTCCTRMRA